MMDAWVARTQPVPQGAFLGLVRNLRAGLPLALLCPARPTTFCVTFQQAVLLMASNLVFAFVWGALVTEAPRLFYMDGFAAIALWTWSVPILAVLVGRKPTGTEPCGLRVAVTLLSPLAAGWVLFAGLVILARYVPFIDALELQISEVFSLWVIVVFAHALHQSGALPRFRALAVSVVYGLLMLFTFEQAAAPVTWYTDYKARNASNRAAPTPAPLDIEKILYDQPKRLAEALAQIETERPGIVDVYFLGFASYSTQDVFKKEIDFVRETFDQRFDTLGRSLLLLNHRDRIDVTPIASVTNLAGAIAGLSQRMNPAEDVLIVYVTSHGSKDHEISVRFPRFPLNPVDPRTLPDLFDELGIEWPAVIVSACYSGGFVPALEGSQSLVMTSAAADRTSFGCGDDSDLTYFARALVEEQLPRMRDLTEAFRRARARLESWEIEEGLTPSNPQLHIGAAMAERLERVRARLDDMSLLAADPTVDVAGASASR